MIAVMNETRLLFWLNNSFYSGFKMSIRQIKSRSQISVCFIVKDLQALRFRGQTMIEGYSLPNKKLARTCSVTPFVSGC